MSLPAAPSSLPASFADVVAHFALFWVLAAAFGILAIWGLRRSNGVAALVGFLLVAACVVVAMPSIVLDVVALLAGNAVAWLAVAVLVLLGVLAFRRSWRGWSFLAIFAAVLVFLFVFGGLRDDLFGFVDRYWSAYVIVGTILLFEAAVPILLALGRRHRDDDPRGPTKAGVAIALGVLLCAGGFYTLSHFEATGVAGIHKSFVSALNLTVGDGDYWDAVKTSHKTTIQTTILPKLQGINATLADYAAAHPEDADAVAHGNVTASMPKSVAENVTAQHDTLLALYGAESDLTTAAAKVRTLTPNHAVWLKVQPLVASGHDDEAEAIVMKAINVTTVTQVLPLNDATVADNTAPCERDTTGSCKTPLKVQEIQHSFFDAHLVANIPVQQGGPEAFEHQRAARAQMAMELKWLAYPALTGLLLAPFAFAGGSILARAWEPSDTVGFRPYPGKAAGFLLLLMGGLTVLIVQFMHMAPPLDIFEVLAIPIAWWVVRDLRNRSLEGQIAL